MADQREDLYQVALGMAALGHGRVEELYYDTVKGRYIKMTPEDRQALEAQDPLRARIASTVPDTRTLIMQKLNAAQLALQEAYKAGMGKNPMVQDVPAFQDMQRLGKEISELMQKVSKVRGL